MPEDFDALNRVMDARYSCRGFRPDPVSEEVIGQIVGTAGKAASWCNAQPWRLVVTPGDEAERVPGGGVGVSGSRGVYDQDRDPVRGLLAKVHDGLPEGGRLVISEPMSGGRRPGRAGDVYFAFYTMAMGTGRVRSAERIGEMCREAGFGNIRAPKARRPFITSVLTCAKPG